MHANLASQQTAAQQQQHQPQMSSSLRYLSAGNDSECAFDNPYFSPDSSEQAQYLQMHNNNNSSIIAGLHQSQDTKQITRHHSPNNSASESVSVGGFSSQRPLHLGDRMNSLHNRQVIQSTTRIVDLTSTRQQTNTTANGSVVEDEEIGEGELVAVDLIGHDFIGLGFNICSNLSNEVKSGKRNQQAGQSKGIFVSKVLSRGPALESKLIREGDRLISLNVSFESMKLQDAIDILTCAAPYKLRLLLEKGAKLSSNSSKYVSKTNLKTKNGQMKGKLQATKDYVKRITNLGSFLQRDQCLQTNNSSNCSLSCNKQDSNICNNNNHHHQDSDELLQRQSLGSAYNRREQIERDVSSKESDSAKNETESETCRSEQVSLDEDSIESNSNLNLTQTLGQTITSSTNKRQDDKTQKRDTTIGIKPMRANATLDLRNLSNDDITINQLINNASADKQRENAACAQIDTQIQTQTTQNKQHSNNNNSCLEQSQSEPQMFVKGKQQPEMHETSSNNELNNYKTPEMQSNEPINNQISNSPTQQRRRALASSASAPSVGLLTKVSCDKRDI